MGVLGCEQRVAKLYDRGVARVAERVELSAPGPSQSSRVVQLQLCARCQFVAQEERGEELEVVFAEGAVVGLAAVLVLPVVALCVHAPPLAPQSRHDAEASHLGVEGGIDGVRVHVVDEAVVVGRVLGECGHRAHARLVLSGGPGLLRRVLVGEASVVACLDLQVLVELVLILQLSLPAAVAYVHGAVLLFGEACRREERRAEWPLLLIDVEVAVVVVAHPAVEGDGGRQLVVVASEALVVGQLGVVHLVVALAVGATLLRDGVHAGQPCA